VFRTRTQTGRKGFTLIELLVVIAIIAILAEILFPVFSKAKAKAHQIACLSNVKELTLGLHMYIADYDDHMPPWGISVAAEDSIFLGNAYGPNNTWLDLVFPYVKNVDIYFCPAHSEGGKTVTEAGWPPATDPDALIASYATSMIAGWSGTMGISMGCVPYPAQKIAFCPGPGVNGPGFDPLYGGRADCITYVEDGGSGAGVRHNDGGNYGFLDGHAKWWSMADSLADWNGELIYWGSYTVLAGVDM